MKNEKATFSATIGYWYQRIAHGTLYNVVQAALRSHLPFTRYKRKYMLIEILGFRYKRDCISNGIDFLSILYLLDMASNISLSVIEQAIYK